MSVRDTDVVDYIYLDDDEETPVLVVSDPLTWRPPEDATHLDMLRHKLNAQIAFVETGQIRDVYPPYGGQRVRVEVVAKCPLNPAAAQLYAIARRTMAKANMDLSFRLWDA